MFSSNTSQVSQDQVFIEDVFSAYLYTGNSSTQTINNGIDLAGKGGLVWLKERTAAGTHLLYDTARGNNFLASNTTGAQGGGSISFTSTGFSEYFNAQSYATWTFRKQPKFFDVVTYTGNGSATQTINHNLGSVPGCIIIKVTSQADDWYVYHRSLSQSSGVPYWLNLNTTAAETFFGGGIMLNATPTSTSFTVKGGVNGNGNTYVAYLFAHDAGGFGLTGSDNVISCGSFTTNGSGQATVSLGYEPQWILVKRTDSTGDWFMIDNMRGLAADPNNPVAMLRANLSNAENTASFVGWSINATGFGWSAGAASATYIYIAIRRGPMKTPTSGTSVFTPIARTGTRAAGSVTGIGFPPDNLITLNRTPGGYQPEWNNKLVGPTKFLKTATTAAEATSTDLASYDQDGVSFNATDFNSIVNLNSPLIQYFMRRAPGLFDVVCYTGTGASSQTYNHNLGVTPELMIVKCRNTSPTDWAVYNSTIGATNYLWLNTTDQSQAFSTIWNNTAPTSSVFTVGSNGQTGASGRTYVAYLFASCPGVSKVGSYTGTGTTKQIDCGFTGGARFVLIKRVDDSGDWYVWDSARGIVAGNDPYLLLNSTAAEVTGTDYVDTLNAGFEISSTAPAAINANGGTFIFLAIA